MSRKYLTSEELEKLLNEDDHVDNIDIDFDSQSGSDEEFIGNISEEEANSDSGEDCDRSEILNELENLMDSNGNREQDCGDRGNGRDVSENMDEHDGQEIAEAETSDDDDTAGIAPKKMRTSESAKKKGKSKARKSEKVISKWESYFTWKQDPDYQPKIHVFDNANSGCKDPDAKTILECFQLFFSADLISMVVEQTNLYHSQIHPDNGSRHSVHNKKWKNVTNNEMYCFLALSLLMPQLRKMRIIDYWTKDTLLATPIFGQIFSRDRFMSILLSIHFSDNESDPRGDKLYKIRSVMTHLQASYKATLYPFQNLCIDESLMLFKGRLSFKQFIPSKRHRFGVKFFVLCDCETGYILNFIIYCGAGTDIIEYNGEVGISGNIVFTLMQDYLDSGHTIYLDNWYSSPVLYSVLYDRKTNACGTVKSNRKYLPDMTKKLEHGEVISFVSNNIIAMKWQDKREVRLLSSCHDAKKIATDKIDLKTGEAVHKPVLVVDYNANMGAVDRSDMLQSSIESVRKTIKWYKKIFFHLLDMSLLNAHALYKMKSGSNIGVAQFQLKLVKELLSEYHVEKPRTTSRRGAEGDSPLRLSGRHFITQSEKHAGNDKPIRRRCVVCSKKKLRKDTSYQCRDCDVPLCLIPCFQVYHTKKEYWR